MKNESFWDISASEGLRMVLRSLRMGLTGQQSVCVGVATVKRN